MSINNTRTITFDSNQMNYNATGTLSEESKPKTSTKRETPPDLLLFTGADYDIEDPLLTPASLETWNENKYVFKSLTKTLEQSPTYGTQLLRHPHRYIIDKNKTIGTGTSKDVYEGRHEEIPIAILFPRADRPKDILKNDASPVKSPHLVCNLDKIQSADGTVLLVQKLYKQNAKEYIRSADASNLLERCLNVAEAAARALHDLHSNGFIHRDLKFENLFVSENEEIVLGDFGGLIQDDGNTHSRYGTRGYIAPEAEMDIPTTHSDVYSLGVMCERMASKLEEIAIEHHSFFSTLANKLKIENYFRPEAKVVIRKIENFRISLLGKMAVA